MTTRNETISEALRRFIRQSGENTMDIERATGISNANLGRFLKGTRGLNLESLDRLAEHFGLRLVQVRRRKRGDE